LLSALPSATPSSARTLSSQEHADAAYGDAHGWVIVADTAADPAAAAAGEYYLHTASGESLWEPPLALAHASAAARAAVRWTRLFDATQGAHYWQHAATGHAQWHPPGTSASSQAALALSQRGNSGGGADDGEGWGRGASGGAATGGETATGTGYSVATGAVAEWEEHWDEPSQAAYWLNARTGESQWEDPFAGSQPAGWNLGTRRHFEQPVASPLRAPLLPRRRSAAAAVASAQEELPGEASQLARRPRPHSASVAAHLASTLDYGDVSSDGGGGGLRPVPRPVSAVRVPRPTPQPQGASSPKLPDGSNTRWRPGSAPAARSNGYDLSYEATG
jgi:hypothetical protein